MHAALLLASSSARSASTLIFTALATISCAALSASATISRAVACASAMMRSPSACAMATASATGNNVFVAAKASAGNRSTVRSAGAAASGALVVALSLPSSRATKTPGRSRAAIVSVETVPISSATGNRLRRVRIAHIAQGFRLRHPLVRRSSMLLATSSQTAARSRSSCLTKVSWVFSASCRYMAACCRK